MKARDLLIILFLSLGPGTVASSAEQDAAKATTTADPNIPLDELELLLRPLTRTELETETLGWLGLLKNKISEISEAEIGAKYKRTELQYADDMQAALDEVEKTKQAAEDKPDDTGAANALEAAIATAKTLEKESKTAANEMEQNTAVKQVTAAAAKYAEELATNDEGGKDDSVEAPEPNSKPSAEQDAGDRKLAKVRAAVSIKAAERAQAREQLRKVKSVNLLSVQIYTPDNQMVIVPNNSVWGSSIINITGSATRRIDLIFGISYDDDIDKAQHIMEEIVRSHERVLKDPEPVIQVHELADSSVNFVCRPWVKTEDYWDVYWDVTRAVKQRFDKEGISIPYPQQDVHHYNVAANVAAAAPAVASLSNDQPVTHQKTSGDQAPANAGDDSEE